MRKYNLQNISLGIFLLLTDLFSYYVCLLVSYKVRVTVSFLSIGIDPFIFDFPSLVAKFWLPLIFVGFIANAKLYNRRLPLFNEFVNLWKTLTIIFVIILAIVSLGRLFNQVSRLMLVFMFMMSLLVFPLMRFVIRRLCYKINIGIQNVLILGAGNTGMSCARELLAEVNWGYKLVGFLDDKYNLHPKKIKIGKFNYSLLGKIADFEKIIYEKDIATTFVAMPSASTNVVASLMSKIQSLSTSVYIVPDLKGIGILNSELFHFFKEQLFLIRVKNNYRSLSNRIIKRLFDLFLGILTLLIVFPLILLASIAIFIESGWPVFFVQKRVAHKGGIFHCFKFRTMYLDSENLLKSHLASNSVAQQEWKKYKKLRTYDPRVTKVGKILRSYSIDELPQLFNVILGSMSLVGPRPYIDTEVKKFQEDMQTIILARPGITGLWQVSGRNGLAFKTRIQLDAWYVRNWSLWLDLYILVKTLKVVFSRDGAY